MKQLQPNNTPSPLRVARFVAGKSLRQLAEPIGRSQMFLSRLERGMCAVVTPELAERIAEEVGLPVETIFPRGDR